MNKPKLQVCLSNNLLNLLNLEGKMVVFIDILRNTTVICSALYNGVEKVKPVSTIEEARSFLGKENHFVAGENHGIKIEDFDFGNTPLAFVNNDKTKGKTLVSRSTNGTQSVRLSKGCAKLVCGAFVNQSVLIKYILEEKMDTILLACGWRGEVNLEDTLFAGLLVNRLKNDFEIFGDPAVLAENLFLQNQNDYKALINKASHYARIANQNQMSDVDFCLTPDLAPVVPVFDGEYLRSI